MASRTLEQRIAKKVRIMQYEAVGGRYTADVKKFDAEQEKKDAVAQANKAIKDRRGIK
jgi:hypothetical protein